MKIGFYTSTFSDLPIEEVLDFAVEAGFDAIELDAGGHIKTPAAVASVVAAARSRGLFVSSIALFGGQLNPDSQAQVAFRDRTHEFAHAIGEAKVPVFVLFGGYNGRLSEPDNYSDFAEHAQSLLAATENTGLNFAIENWPGPDNRYIATTPSGWSQLFALVNDERWGLEFDPSHLLRLGIDPLRALEGVRDHVKILHAKDTSIDSAALQANGYHGEGWWRYRLPGKGLLDWVEFLKQASRSFDGTISIEHEDADYGWPQNDLAARKAGEQLALSFLRSTLSAL